MSKYRHARCTRLLGTSTLAKLLCLFLDSSGLILKWSFTTEEVYTHFLHTCNSGAVANVHPSLLPSDGNGKETQ